MAAASPTPRGMSRILAALFAVLAFAIPQQSWAWGPVGHSTVVTIARSYLTPKAQARIEEILAADPDTLTGKSMADRANWADAWRLTHPETFNWHFVDIEIDDGDMKAACYGYPAQGPLASVGPADDCVVDKIDAFSRELRDPKTSDAERLLALKFLLHFVGDMHQPLHSTDNHDRGGNCVLLNVGAEKPSNLHAYWDLTVINGMTTGPHAFAAALRTTITPAQKAAWEQGDARAWALETFETGKATTYSVATTPGCDPNVAPITLPDGYEAMARKTITMQLQKAGVRMAKVLNTALN
jgi:hypothetical protein